MATTTTTVHTVATQDDADPAAATATTTITVVRTVAPGTGTADGANQADPLAAQSLAEMLGLGDAALRDGCDCECDCEDSCAVASGSTGETLPRLLLGIGDPVHYIDGSGGCIAALITAIDAPTGTLHLCTFDPQHGPIGRFDVPLALPALTPPGRRGHTWHPKEQ